MSRKIAYYGYAILYYSLRRASTGSFLVAMREGTKPAKKVNPTLIAINIKQGSG